MRALQADAEPISDVDVDALASAPSAGAGAGSGAGSGATAGAGAGAGPLSTLGGSSNTLAGATAAEEKYDGVDVEGSKELEVLMKRSKKAMLKQWGPKVLRLRGRVLSVYRTATDADPKDSVVIRDGCSAVAWFDATRPFGMEFKSPARTWLFVMNSQAQRNEWIREIRARIVAPRTGTCAR